MSKPYSVWCKQVNAPWRMLFESYAPNECGDYAHNKIVHGNNVERIEIRELSGERLETVWDKEWKS